MNTDRSGASHSHNSLKQNHHRWEPGFLKTSHRFDALASLGFDFENYIIWPTIDDYNALLDRLKICNARGIPLRCIPAGPKARSRAQKQRDPPYEVQVLERGLIPTRLENWHDFCNMLAWCRFPKTKGTLNQLQARPHGVPRNRYQELMTMFDEGGVIRLYEDLSLAIPTQVGLVHFGHALHEADLVGFKNSTGFSLRLEVPTSDFDLSQQYAWVDETAALVIASGQLTKH